MWKKRTERLEEDVQVSGQGSWVDRGSTGGAGLGTVGGVSVQSLSRV